MVLTAVLVGWPKALRSCVHITEPTVPGQPQSLSQGAQSISYPFMGKESPSSQPLAPKSPRSEDAGFGLKMTGNTKISKKVYEMKTGKNEL